jgi:hypothetical protein
MTTARGERGLLPPLIDVLEVVLTSLIGRDDAGEKLRTAFSFSLE